MRVSVFRLLHGGGHRGKIRTCSWVGEDLGTLWMSWGKDTLGNWGQTFPGLAGKAI